MKCPYCDKVLLLNVDEAYVRKYGMCGTCLADCKETVNEKDTWRCPECNVLNTDNAHKCPVCYTLKPKKEV